LKPDASPVDGGQPGSAVPALLSSQAPYLVRLIKPNLIASHDWHVQPICQRSLRVIRLGGTPWIEARTRVRIVLELGALRRISAFAHGFRRFDANPPKLSKRGLRVKEGFRPNHAG
jgi:hypothetical protein